MIGNLSGAHLIAILAIVLLIFGAPRLPALAKSLGQSMRILKREAFDAAVAQPEDAAPGDTTEDTADPPRTTLGSTDGEARP